MTSLSHAALLYEGLDEFTEAVSEFVDSGLRASEPVLIALPASKLDALAYGDEVQSVAMEALGRNPGRIMPEIVEWVAAQDGRPCHFVGEPVWPGRTQAETVEAIRHEALINVAFADVEVRVLCPYDAGALETSVLEQVERAHPCLVEHSQRRRSSHYGDPVELWRAANLELEEPGDQACDFEITDDLGALRASVKSWALAAGMERPRVSDLVLAVNEAASNSLLHGSPPARVLAWLAEDRAVCEVQDSGELRDPMAGRVRPTAEAASGRGVWLINQLCDLVELRPGDDGTTIRMQVPLSG